MTNNFQSWENDPFFSAAEQVQDSADRLESTYRAWIHAKSLSCDVEDNRTIEFCRRELSTALGIANGQLEEFEKEVLFVSTKARQPHQQHAEDDVERHRQFIEAICSQLFSIKNALLCSKDERDLKVLPAVSMGREESDNFADFLCGSRIRTCDDAKDMLGSCTTADKGYKEVAISCQSGSRSTSTSRLDYRMVLFGSLDECFSPRETHESANTHEPHLSYETCISKNPIVNRPQSHGAMVKDADLICINVDQSVENAPCAASGLLPGDCYVNVGMCIERTNGHHRSISVGGNLSCCTERPNGHQRTASVVVGLNCGKDGPSASDSKTSHKQATNSSASNIWSSLSKAGLIFGSGGSQDGLKRWKDGEGDAIDLCGISDGDFEANCSIFLCQDGRRYKGCAEALKIFQSPGKAVSMQWLVQATLTVLAALGLLGLYFR